MNAHLFIQDLAILVVVSGITTVLCHIWRQPVVLGYMLAGVLIGPHVLPVSPIHDPATIQTLGELGVIFVLLALGLEFSLKKIWQLGFRLWLSGIAELSLMLAIFYSVARSFDYSHKEALFMGAILCVASTMIVIKVIEEMGLKKEKFAQLSLGILVVEDLAVVLILTMLSTVAAESQMNLGFTYSLGLLVIFLTAAVVIGLAVVPKLLHYIHRWKSAETLLIVVIGLCFGLCWLALNLGYSLALGAFLTGAVMAESRITERIKKLIEPLRDLFAAIFFTSVGFLLDPMALWNNLGLIVVLALLLTLGKTASNTLILSLTGINPALALKVGLSLAQIGEFSFIIAAWGVSLGVVSEQLYSVVVGIGIITATLTPYRLKYADTIAQKSQFFIPQKIAGFFAIYQNWLGTIQPSSDRKMILNIMRRILFHVVINFILIVAIFMLTGYFAEPVITSDFLGNIDHSYKRAFLWTFCLLVSLPFLWVIYSKLKALSLLLAEISIGEGFYGAVQVRRIIAEAVPVLGIAVVLLLMLSLSVALLPPLKLLLLSLVTVGIAAAFLGRWLVQWHIKIQIALTDLWRSPPNPKE